MIATDTIARLATEPIPGEQRAGQDPRYDAAFEALEAEIGKLEALTGGEVDWGAVELGATGILTERSKHLLVAVRLVRAWYQKHGLDGLEAGLRLLHGLCSAFWDDGFPEANRLRARAGALRWLSENLASIITETRPDDVRALAACREAMTALLELIQPRFSDGDCGLGGLRRALDVAAANAAVDAAAMAAAPDGIPATGSPASATPMTTTGSSPVATANRGGPITSRDEALRRLREIADWFQRHDPHSPVGYLAQRAVNLGSMGFQDAFADLLQNNAGAQSELWQVLGLKPQGG